MNTLRNTPKGPVWALLFDSVIIIFCVASTVETNNWGYLLIAAGLTLLTVIWYFNPIPLDHPISSIVWIRLKKWKSVDFAVIGGLVLLISGLYIAFH
jgi:hypothetical protein